MLYFILTIGLLKNTVVSFTVTLCGYKIQKLAGYLLPVIIDQRRPNSNKNIL